jgi:hypothetical protein
MAWAACCARLACAATGFAAKPGAAHAPMLQNAAAARIEMRMARRNAEFLSGERAIPIFNLKPAGFLNSDGM